MGVSLEKKCEYFCYTEQQRIQLSHCLKEPTWDEHTDAWNEILKDITKAEVQADRLGAIAGRLEALAVFCLKDLCTTQSNKNSREIQKVKRIGKLAGDLVQLLNEPNSYRSTYGSALLDIKGIGLKKRKRGDKRRKLKVLRELELIANNIDQVIEGFKSSHKTHKPFAKTPEQDGFVYGLCLFWRMWKGEEPGGSKEGGPAPRFLMLAVNPVQAFAEKELGKTLSQTATWPITEGAAGELIHRVMQQKRIPK